MALASKQLIPGEYTSKGRFSRRFSVLFLTPRFAKNHHKNLRRWGAGMSETLYQRMNPVAVCVGSSVRRLFTFSTCWENKWTPQPYVVDSLSICSMMQSSVPWRRSRNGDTTTICKQASVCLSFSRGCLRDRKISWKFRNSEQHAKHEPKIGVHDEVLVSNETVEAQWEDQQKGVPENRKPDWKPHRSFQILGGS